MGKLVGLLAVALLSACGAFGADNGPDADPDDMTSASKPTKKQASDTAEPPTDDSIGEQLDPFFAEELKKGNIPGVAVAVLGDGHVKWSKGFGVADLTTKQRVDQDTLFLLGGVSTALTAVAFMQLVQDPTKGVTLDTDVSTKVGFNVRSPSSPNTPITFRMLLTHTAGLDEQVPSLSVGDSPTPLATYVKAAVAVDANWTAEKPGTNWLYSNLGFALVGLAVEKIAGQNLQDYSKTHLFAPLGMNETSWFLKNLDPNHLAQPYDGPELAPQGQYGYPDYPATMLRTSASQLAQFALMLADGGMLGSAQILDSNIVSTMETLQIPTVDPVQALTFYRADRGGHAVVGLEGWDRGAHAEMFIDPIAKAGYVLIVNTHDATSDTAFKTAMERMSTKLMTLAVTLP